jgi:hypothetical protein
MQKHVNNLSNDTLPLTTHQEEEARKQKRMTALSDFAGSMKDTWKDVDALEYQKKLREERTIG